MKTVRTSFSPREHGFRFANFFESRLPVKFDLPIVGSVDLNNVIFGLCGGMCFTALDYFNEGNNVPASDDSLKLDKKLFTYLCDRQLDSLQIPVLLKIIEWMLAEDDRLASTMSRFEVPKLRRRLDKGEPVVLCLIRVRGWGNPTLNHQVLATGYDFDPETKQMEIQLYDPNHPRKDVNIHLNLSNPKEGLNLHYSSGEPLRAFFMVPYHRPFFKPLPAISSAQAGVPQFGLGEAILPALSLRWPVDSSRINQRFGENPDTYRPFGLAGHEGLDLFAQHGANIYAAADGEVSMAKNAAGHPYGKQVRIKHNQNGVDFETIYAHLDKLQVQTGQQVRAGELIGLADNSGNSFGDHLHFTLKIAGQQTSGYPAGIVDPLPFFQTSDGQVATAIGSVPASSGVKVYTSLGLKLRQEPTLEGQVVSLLPAGEVLEVLGDAAAVAGLIGAQDKWLRVKTASGQGGFVAAWLCRDTAEAFPPSDLIVYPHEVINLRNGPGTGFPSLTEIGLGTPLTVLGDDDLARGKVGRENQWLQVQTEEGKRGFVAAWLVHETGHNPPSSRLNLYPTTAVNLRARPDADANILVVLVPTDTLTVLGDAEAAKTRVGQQDAWINVRASSGHSGYVAAWLVSTQPIPPAQLNSIGALVVFPSVDVNLRAQPSVNAPRLDGLPKNEPFEVIESDVDAARAKIGQDGMWIYGQKQGGKRGWVAAWFLSGTQS